MVIRCGLVVILAAPLWRKMKRYGIEIEADDEP